MSQPPDPANLVENEVIHLVILSERERVRQALGDLLVPPSKMEEFSEEIDEEALFRELNEAIRGQPPLSETIIQERREGP